MLIESVASLAILNVLSNNVYRYDMQKHQYLVSVNDQTDTANRMSYSGNRDGDIVRFNEPDLHDDLDINKLIGQRYTNFTKYIFPERINLLRSKSGNYVILQPFGVDVPIETGWIDPTLQESPALLNLSYCVTTSTTLSNDFSLEVDVANLLYGAVVILSNTVTTGQYGRLVTCAIAGFLKKVVEKKWSINISLKQSHAWPPDSASDVFGICLNVTLRSQYDYDLYKPHRSGPTLRRDNNLVDSALSYVEPASFLWNSDAVPVTVFSFTDSDRPFARKRLRRPSDFDPLDVEEIFPHWFFA